MCQVVQKRLNWGQYLNGLKLACHLELCSCVIRRTCMLQCGIGSVMSRGGRASPDQAGHEYAVRIYNDVSCVFLYLFENLSSLLWIFTPNFTCCLSTLCVTLVVSQHSLCLCQRCRPRHASCLMCESCWPSQDSKLQFCVTIFYGREPRRCPITYFRWKHCGDCMMWVSKLATLAAFMHYSILKNCNCAQLKSKSGIMPPHNHTPRLSISVIWDQHP